MLSKTRHRKFNPICISNEGERLIGRILRIYHEYVGGIENPSPGSSIGITRDRFFYSILTQIMDSFSCSPFNTSFILEKLSIDFQKILNTLRCDTVTSFLHRNDVTGRRAASVGLFVFFLSFPRTGTGVR